MHERSVSAARWILLGTLLVAGACAPSASDFTVTAAAQRGDQERMAAQRPLVAAASHLRRGVDNGQFGGYASLVIEERDVAVHERSAALYERDEALDERAAANFERKNAIAERDAAFAERDRAVEAHRAAVGELEALERRVAEAEQARAEEIASQPAVGAVRATPAGQGDSPHRPGLAWAQRIVALIVLVVWAIVVYKVLHGLV